MDTRHQRDKEEVKLYLQNMFTEANVYDKMVELLNKVSDAGQSPNYWGNKQANKIFFKP